MTFRPLEDRIVIRPDKAEEVSAGGIALPASAIEQQFRGTVLSIGPGRYNEVRGETVPVVSVREGAHVVYSPHGGYEIKIDSEDEKVIVLTPREILGVLDE